MNEIITPAGRPIQAPDSMCLVLLVQYTRERRSHEARRFEALSADDHSTARLHSNGYTRLSEAMTNVTITALQTGYDMELLSWIVQGATDRQLETLACDATDAATVALMADAMRRPVAPAPMGRKPKAPKAPARLRAPQGAYQEMADQLRSASTRAQACDVLMGCTIPELKAVWALTGRTDRIPSKLRKAGIIEFITEALVGNRLDVAAIMNAK